MQLIVRKQALNIGWIKKFENLMDNQKNFEQNLENLWKTADRSM